MGTRINGAQLTQIKGSNAVHGETFIYSASIAVQLETYNVQSVTIQAKLDNAGNITIGDSYGQHVTLDAGDSVRLEVSNLNLLYISGDTVGDGINYTAIAVSARSVPPIVTENIVAEYPLTEGSGQVFYDHRGSGLDGTLGSGSGSDAADPTWSDLGLTGDGSGDYAQIEVWSTLTDDFTIIIAGKYGATFTNFGPIFAMGFASSDSFRLLYRDSSGLPGIRVDGASLTFDDFAQNEGVNNPFWYAVTFDRSAGTGTAYQIISGSLVSTAITLSAIPSGAPTAIRLLSNESGTENVLHTVSYVAPFSGILTEAQVQRMYDYTQPDLEARGLSI